METELYIKVKQIEITHIETIRSYSWTTVNLGDILKRLSNGYSLCTARCGNCRGVQLIQDDTNVTYCPACAGV